MLKIVVLAEDMKAAKNILKTIIEKENLIGKWCGSIFWSEANVYFAFDTSFKGEYDQVIIKADTYTNELHKAACHLLKESCVPEEYQILPI